MTSQAQHQELLQMYCRVCGKRSIPGSKNPQSGLNGVTLKQSPMFKSFLSHLHDLEVDHESPEIFPKRICQRCVEKFRSVRVTVQSEKPDTGRLNVFELANSLHVYHSDDDLRQLARKFPVADFWAHSSSALQQCGVCEDGATTHTVVHSDADHIRTCHLYVQEVVMEDEWGEPAASDAVKSYKIVDIRDITVAFKPPQPSPAKDASGDGTGRSEDAGIKRSHSQDPAVGNNHVTGATDPKKPKLDGAATSGKVAPSPTKPSTTPGSSATTNSNNAPSTSTSVYQNLWPEFSNMLGKNRKYRSDKIAEILNQYITEVPKVISDLKSSGIVFKAETRQNHFVKNEEFRKHVAKCLTMLQKVPTSKKSLLLFRAITDTASDGQLNILAYVGIEIDLTNPNLGFLLRRIRNRASASQQQQQPAKPQQVQKSPVKQGNNSGNGTKSALQNIPQGITISKVPTASGTPAKQAQQSKLKAPNSTSVTSARPTNLGSAGNKATPQSRPKKPASAQTPKTSNSKSLAPKAPVVTITPIQANSVVPPLKVKVPPAKPSSSASSSSSSHRFPAPKSKKKLPDVSVKEELFDDVNINRILLQTKIRQLNAQIPVNRQMKADIVRDVLLRRSDTKELMASHGILFDPEGGNYHLKALDQQRGNGRKKVEKLTSSLNVYEWRACIASMVYDLLHPEDSLTLRIVGIFIDPTHEKVPLHFRLNFALKRTLLMSPYSACIMNHLYENVQVLGTGDGEVDSWEMGLVELLYCDRKDAKQLFKCAKDTKASPKAPKVPPIVISKGRGAAAGGKAGGSKQPQQQMLKNSAAATRSPVIVQLRPKGGQPPANPTPTVVRLTPRQNFKAPPKGAGSRSKKKPDTYYNNKAKISQLDTSRSSRRATRKKTEQRIHEMAKLESMTDNEFEDDYPGSGGLPQGGSNPMVELEQDPLFDPLSLPDDGQSSSHQQHHMMPAPVQTEAFMPNLVEIKTEIFEEYDNPVEEGVSPGSPTNHEELDLQDDLEHAEQDQNCQPENHVEEPRRIINPHPHIIHENSEEENETEDEVEEEDTNGLDSGHQVNPNIEEPLNPVSANQASFEQSEGSTPMHEDQSSTPVESTQSVDENQSYNSPMDHQSGGDDNNSSYQNQPVEYREEDHGEANPLSEEVDHFANPDQEDDDMENPIDTDENGFSNLQITNVETAVSSDNLIPSPTPSFEDVVSTSAAEVPSEPDKALLNTHFDENQMQELESLEEMLSYTTQEASSSSTGPVVAHHEVAHNVVGHVEFDFAHFGVEESDNQEQKEPDALDVLNSLASMPIPDAFGYAKDTSAINTSSVVCDSVDSIIQEVAGMNSMPFDPSNLQ